jgi:hypothetical protein
MGEFTEKIKGEKNNTPILYLIISLLGLDIVVYALIQNDINKRIEEK